MNTLSIWTGKRRGHGLALGGSGGGFILRDKTIPVIFPHFGIVYNAYLV
jgi:hypothetical protein